MKKLSYILVLLTWLFFADYAISASVFAGENGGVIYIPIEEEEDKSNKRNNRTVGVPIQCWYDAEECAVFVESLIGILDISIQNHSLTSCTHQQMESDDISELEIPISGSPGYYTITIYTEDDRVFWGEFWISL